MSNIESIEMTVSQVEQGPLWPTEKVKSQRNKKSRIMKNQSLRQVKLIVPENLYKNRASDSQPPLVQPKDSIECLMNSNGIFLGPLKKCIFG